MGVVPLYVCELPDSARGKLKAVYLDPADSNTVIESNEATFNGGVDDPYPTALLSASSSHYRGALTVTVQGAGLDAVQTVALTAPDASWRVPLTVVARTNSSLTASGVVAAPVPTCLVEASCPDHATSSALLNGDSTSDLMPDNYCLKFFPGSQDTADLQPKDFSLVFGSGTWHLFYIRRHQSPGYYAAVNERNLGHAIADDATDLGSWTVKPTVLQVRPDNWDNLHVWAPHVYRKRNDPTYYMFYTGVTAGTPACPGCDIQRIGVATSYDLYTWQRDDSWIYSKNDVRWCYGNRDSTTLPGWQFRDPFVVEDPDTLGHYFMYLATVDTSGTPVVGVAKSTGDLRVWRDVGALPKTKATMTGAGRVESPHAFRTNGKWWLLYTGTYTN